MANELAGRTFKFLRNGAAETKTLDWSEAYEALP
jgi:hypothetical protein